MIENTEYSGTQQRQKSVSYISSIKAAEAYLLSRNNAFVEHGEFRAALTHWLMNPDYKPPLMPENVWEILHALFTIPVDGNRKSAVSERGLPRQLRLSQSFYQIPYPPPDNPSFTFIDLFAGIGGFRIAFQNVGGKCVFSSEWDKYAQRTYEANFGDMPYGDIRKIEKQSIPDHDVLVAGFPCQPFSLAGVSKKKSLGRKHGFEDETQGTLFFEIKEILKIKRPAAFMLENVKNLLAHDNKRTFEVIRYTLEDKLGYTVRWNIVDGARWVPQHRERIFLVGYDPDRISISREEIEIPEGPPPGYPYPLLRDIIRKKVDGYTLGPGTWETLVRHREHHKSIGQGFGYGLHTFPIPKNSVTRTISARYHKDGAEVLIEQHGDRPRRLTIGEALQLLGFNPGRFLIPVSNTQAYRQIGNSVVVPAVEACARRMAEVLDRCQK